MFKKLLSNLPFNPSLITQLAFYAKRVHREASVRRLGLVFLVLAMALQVFAVVSPPQPTLAESSNDIIRGGFANRDQAVLNCIDPAKDINDILAYYGVSCDMLAHAQENVFIKSTDFGGALDSIGRNEVANPSPRNHKNWNIYQVNIPGVAQPLWMKDLQYWDSFASSTYKVLKITNDHNQTIYIMYDCGNIVTINKFVPPPPPTPPPVDVCPLREGTQLTLEECDACPNIPGTQNSPAECFPCPEAQQDDSTTACLEFSKKAANETQNIADANGTTAHAGDVITYTLVVKNTGLTNVKDFIVEENLSDVLEYARVLDLHGGTLNSHQHVVWPRQDIGAGQIIRKFITVRVKDPIPQTPVSASDPGSFDLIMTNVFYGISINIKLPPSITKTTEQITRDLPNTGPGTSLIVGFGLTTVVAYFFARSKLFAAELAIVKDDFSSGGTGL